MKPESFYSLYSRFNWKTDALILSLEYFNFYFHFQDSSELTVLVYPGKLKASFFSHCSAAASLNKLALVFLQTFWHDSNRKARQDTDKVQCGQYCIFCATTCTHTASSLSLSHYSPSCLWEFCRQNQPNAWQMFFSPSDNRNNERTVPLSHCHRCYPRSLLTPQKPVPFSKSSSGLILDLSGSTAYLSTDV